MCNDDQLSNVQLLSFAASFVFGFHFLVRRSNDPTGFHVQCGAQITAMGWFGKSKKKKEEEERKKKEEEEAKNKKDGEGDAAKKDGEAGGDAPAATADAKPSTKDGDDKNEETAKTDEGKSAAEAGAATATPSAAPSPKNPAAPGTTTPPLQSAHASAPSSPGAKPAPARPDPPMMPPADASHGMGEAAALPAATASIEVPKLAPGSPNNASFRPKVMPGGILMQQHHQHHQFQQQPQPHGMASPNYAAQFHQQHPMMHHQQHQQQHHLQHHHHHHAHAVIARPPGMAASMASTSTVLGAPPGMHARMPLSRPPGAKVIVSGASGVATPRSEYGDRPPGVGVPMTIPGQPTVTRSQSQPQIVTAAQPPQVQPAAQSPQQQQQQPAPPALAPIARPPPAAGGAVAAAVPPPTGANGSFGSGSSNVVMQPPPAGAPAAAVPQQDGQAPSAAPAAAAAAADSDDSGPDFEEEEAPASPRAANEHAAAPPRSAPSTPQRPAAPQQAATEKVASPAPRQTSSKLDDSASFGTDDEGDRAATAGAQQATQSPSPAAPAGQPTVAATAEAVPAASRRSSSAKAPSVINESVDTPTSRAATATSAGGNARRVQMARAASHGRSGSSVKGSAPPPAGAARRSHAAALAAAPSVANASSDTLVFHESGKEFSQNVAEPDPSTMIAREQHLRLWVRDRFSRMLCPQQYYGRAVKVHNIRPLIPRPRPVASNHVLAVYALRESAEQQRITERGFQGVVNDGSHRFATQIQLDPRTSRKVNTHRVTTYALAEIPVARQRFAETTGEAMELLDQGLCSSVFVTEASAHLVADLSTVVVHALIDVTWTLFSDDEPPTCPAHRVPLQLFDPESRQLLCALCTANDANRAECIVLNDMFSGASLRSIQRSLGDRLGSVQQRVQQQVAAHRAAATASDRRRQAIELQFSLVQAALDAKRNELMGIIEEEGRARDVASARVIFTDNEVRRHLQAALAHARDISTVTAEADSDASPAFAQMATVVSSLAHMDGSNDPSVVEYPSSLNSPSGDVDKNLKVNLEHVIRTITEVSFKPARSARGEAQEGDHHGAGGQSPARGRPASPMRHAASPSKRYGRTRTEPIHVSPQQRGLSPTRRPVRSNKHHTTGLAPTAIVHSQPSSADQSFNSAGVLQPVIVPERKRAMSAKRSQAEALGPNGTLLFNVPLAGLIAMHTAVEWKLRVDDCGSWVGVGVGVGDDFNALCQSQTCDTRHLWIAPTNAPRFLRLRVVVGPHKRCKLTIHDIVGRQLDDNRIPHWPTGRLAYPQVTFGATPGHVVMVESPHGVSGK